MRPGLLELAAILRSCTSQDSTWVYLFGPKSPTLIYFHPRPAPVRHKYVCARSQGNGDFDTPTTSLSLIFNRPLLSYFFTSVSLHTKHHPHRQHYEDHHTLAIQSRSFRKLAFYLRLLHLQREPTNLRHILRSWSSTPSCR